MEQSTPREVGSTPSATETAGRILALHTHDIGISVETAVATAWQLHSRHGGVWRVSGTTDPETAQFWWETSSASVVDGALATGAVELPLTEPASVTVFIGDLLGERTAPTFDETDTTFLLHVPYVVPDAEADDLDSWYLDEHDEMVMRCTDWTAVRRYLPSAESTAPWTRLVVHELRSGDVLTSPFVQEAMQTDARRGFAARPWFLAGGRTPVAVLGTTA